MSMSSHEVEHEEGSSLQEAKTLAPNPCLAGRKRVHYSTDVMDSGMQKWNLKTSQHQKRYFFGP